MYSDNDPRLGLCCLLVGDEKTKFKTVKRGWAQRNADTIHDKLLEVWRNNIAETCRVLNYCVRNDIWCYRLSSDLFALADLEEYSDLWKDFRNDDSNWNTIRVQILRYIELGGRLSTHPGQYCVISNDNLDISRRSIINLEHHAEFFDAMEIPRNYFFPINIHISNGKREKDAARSVRNNLRSMSSSLVSRLVFENEDKSFWTYQNIQEYFPEFPITLDYHHRLINNQGETEQSAHEACFASWSKYNIKPLFHYTEGRDKELDRSHADYIKKLPMYRDMDIEIEAKKKNLAILKVRKHHNM